MTRAHHRPHKGLVGDSIFDNEAYVEGGRSVVEHLQDLLRDEIDVTLLAIDGSFANEVPQQLERQRGPNVARIIKQLGGAKHLLNLLAALQGKFRLNYREALGALEKSSLPVAAPAVYDSIPNLCTRYLTAVSLFNDVIIQDAAKRGLLVIDLRAISPEASEYSPVSPIEPSDSGGRKVAAARCSDPVSRYRMTSAAVEHE